MINVSNNPNGSTATIQNQQNTQRATGKSDFAAALSSSENLLEISSSLLDNLLKVKRSDAGNNTLDFSPIFPFSSEFEATFGIGGPLPAFINKITTKLNLSAEKNQALQNIAINNKDITKTPENVQKIAAELKAAGIGY